MVALAALVIGAVASYHTTTLISVLSASTRHIGIGATVSTSFGEPYHVARTFASIDHLSRGRAAWNVVTSSAGKAALNFSREAHMEHDLRYEVAQEVVFWLMGGLDEAVAPWNMG